MPQDSNFLLRVLRPIPRTLISQRREMKPSILDSSSHLRILEIGQDDPKCAPFSSLAFHLDMAVDAFNKILAYVKPHAGPFSGALRGEEWLKHVLHDLRIRRTNSD